VASFGVSAYELAACGVPAVHLALTTDHERSSSAFEREGIAITAGAWGDVQPAAVATAVAALIGDARRRKQIAARAPALVDGRGASRAANAIVK
jgi:spore coat polysaccharide biosynthesis protein SpsF